MSEPYRDFICTKCRVIHGAACPVERDAEQGRAALRVSRELRQFLSAAPDNDDDAQSLLSDCDELDRIGQKLLSRETLNVISGVREDG